MSDYSLREASRILRVTPQRLRYWEETSLLEVQDGPAARGSGPFRFDDLVLLKHVLRLIEGGVSLRRIRRSVADVRALLPDLRQPLGSLRVWADGSRRVVVRHDGDLFEPDGQMVLDFGENDSPVEALRGEQGPGDSGRDAAIYWFEEGCRLDDESQAGGAAEQAFRRAVAADPTFADAHCNLGTVLYNRGKRSAAADAFEAALAADPHHVESHFNLATLLEDAGRDQAALGHLKHVVRVDPLYADAHLNLALLYEKLAVRNRARDHWRRYLQADPGGSWADVARSRLEGS